MKSETDLSVELQGSRTDSLENSLQPKKHSIQKPATFDQLKVEKIGSQTIPDEEEEKD